MAAYKFRVAFEDFDDIYRDIEIKPSQTFKDFHEAITRFISFETGRNSSFFISDDNWLKGREITSRDLREEEMEKIAEMDNAVMRDFIADPHQKIYYLYDLSSPWAFRIELIKIVPNDDPMSDYPRCVRSIGDAPKQFAQILLEPLPDPEDSDDDVATDEEEMEKDELHVSAIGIEADEIPESIDEEVKGEEDEVLDPDITSSEEEEEY
jgi:hypothetical protein